VDGSHYAAFLAALGHAVGDPVYDPLANLDGTGMVTLVDYQMWLECYRNYVGDPNAAAPELPDSGDQDGDVEVDVGDLHNTRELPVRTGRDSPARPPSADPAPGVDLRDYAHIQKALAGRL
jgi:hypothetical protein